MYIEEREENNLHPLILSHLIEARKVTQTTCSVWFCHKYRIADTAHAQGASVAQINHDWYSAQLSELHLSVQLGFAVESLLSQKVYLSILF